MFLSRMEDEEIGSNNIFSIEVKSGKLYFTFNKDKHVIGSKIYPVSKKNHVQMFDVTNTSRGEYQDVQDLLKSMDWKYVNGKCYDNAEVLYDAFQYCGYDAKYYAGWLWIGAGYPFHHAWVVVDDSVYDIAYHLTSQKVLIDQELSGKDIYSRENVREVKRLMKTVHPVGEHFIWGQVEEIMMYAGSEDTPEGAKNRYIKMMKQFPNHPTYNVPEKQEGDIHFKSRYQILLGD